MIPNNVTYLEIPLAMNHQGINIFKRKLLTHTQTLFYLYRHKCDILNLAHQIFVSIYKLAEKRKPREDYPDNDYYHQKVQFAKGKNH